MFYYRYRSGSELSIKELIYDEIYFASKAECNDPYEGKAFVKLEKNEELWNNLIRHALNFFNSSVTEYLIKRVVQFYISKAPMYIDEFLNISQKEFLCLGTDKFEKTILDNMLQHIKQYVSVYLPPEQYFASFSKRNNNYLMWSHYANNHQGFCLIFQTVQGKIWQNPQWKKTQLPISVPSLPQSFLALTIPDGFEVKDVIYSSKPQYLDGFMCFSSDIVKDKYTANEINKFQTNYSSTYFQKHSVWSYEEESRIILPNGYPNLTGRTVIMSPHQRLFHYDPNQLVGIVLGTKMPDIQRNKIKEIISEKVSRQKEKQKESILDFVLFEERLSETNREVIITPLEIYSNGNVINITHSDFSNLYSIWKQKYKQ